MKCNVMTQAASQQPSVPSKSNRLAPRYHLTLNQVKQAYKSYRKGRGFHASTKVLWKNRHRLVFGNRNQYKFGRYESYRIREKEYLMISKVKILYLLSFSYEWFKLIWLYFLTIGHSLPSITKWIFWGIHDVEEAVTIFASVVDILHHFIEVQHFGFLAIADE